MQRYANGLTTVLHTRCHSLSMYGSETKHTCLTNIETINKVSKVLTSFQQLTACMAIDRYCDVKGVILAWTPDIIHECPFTLEEELRPQQHGRALVNQWKNKFFQLRENVTGCSSIQIWLTAEGFNLRNDKIAKQLEREETDTKIIETAFRN